MTEYPSNLTLKKVSDFDILKTNFKGINDFLEFMKDIWHLDGFRLDGKNILKLELHTLGWSGNEDIIDALRKSNFWQICWQKSIRGGHYYFEIRRDFYVSQDKNEGEKK
ncbi:MAG: hypothetical protein AABY22_11290 [Nanoarchaeota archaeon]